MSATYEIERLLRGVRFKLSRRLPTRTPHEVWPALSDMTIRSRPFSARFGNVKLNEVMLLCAVVKSIKAQRIFEFGTFDGLTTWHLAANSTSPSTVYTLDLPIDHRSRQTKQHDRDVGKIQGVVLGKWFHETDEEQRIVQLFGDSIHFDISPYRQTIDFCFIDASHEFHHVMRDTESALSMVVPGGVIFWHDYSRWWPGVQKCLDDLSRSLPVVRIAETSLAALIVAN
jgi:predicted O-methyltransferase YrrM